MKEIYKILLVQLVVGALLSFILTLLLQAVFFGAESLNFQLDIIKTVIEVIWKS